jgi:tRNA(Phe) wybutosine-synthesizing methylase Tyw3
MNHVLPSFPSLRARNLRTLYGDDNDDSVKRRAVPIDKSPKGSVDERIRPLVDLINSHPDYITLSSCSGRVALFDPGEYADDVAFIVDKKDEDEDDIDDDDNDVDEHVHTDIVNGGGGGGRSGKGRGGRWIFVTHDVLPDLGERVIDSLRRVGNEMHRSIVDDASTGRSRHRRRCRTRVAVTFKHEPPLLHVGACNLESGRRLLRMCKGECAMRESGLIVTDSRVTVEVRTNSTSLCLPIWLDARAVDPALAPRHRRRGECENDDENDDDYDNGQRIVVDISPNENYIRMLSDMANERMMRNGDMIDRLFRCVRAGLAFPPNDSIVVGPADSTGTTNDDDGHDGADCCLDDEGDEGAKGEGGGESVARSMTADDEDDGKGVFDYRVTLRHALPPLNLWKTAAVVVRYGGSRRSRNDITDEDEVERGRHDIDVDVLAFGGQGIGPALLPSSADHVDHINDVSTTTSMTGSSMSGSRRHDDVYRLKRRHGNWSDRWETLSRIACTSTITERVSTKHVSSSGANVGPSSAHVDGIAVVNTSAGKFRVRVASEGMGRREGHAAVVVPKMSSPRRMAAVYEGGEESAVDAVIVFGGRTTTTESNGQGRVRRSLMPSNEMFLFVLLPLSSPSLSSDSSNNKHMEDVAGGLFSRPIDVRGTPPEPRFGHTMTVLSNNIERCRGRPFAVVAGGTGLSSDDVDPYPSFCLASIYTISCIALDGGGDAGGDSDYDVMDGSMFSHFVWDRVADMPGPRSYHASFALGGSSDGCDIFMFGGYGEAHDPFTSSYASSSSSSSTWFKTPLHIAGKGVIDVADDALHDHTNAMSNIAVENTMLLPARIGSSAVSLSFPKSRRPLVLVVGGVKSTSTSALAPSSDSTGRNEYRDGFDDCDEGRSPPLILFAPKRNRGHHPTGLTRIHSSKLEVINMCDSIIGSGGYVAVDFGACVHHCLVALPRGRDDDDDDCASVKVASPMIDDVYPASAIIVGGGVPSLSFGQSYAR